MDRVLQNIGFSCSSKWTFSLNGISTMKLPLTTPALLSALLVGMGVGICNLAAQPTTTVFSTLHSFNGRDGSSPESLILSGSTLYGVTKHGGVSNAGTVFSVHTDGTGFTILHIFTGGSDGATPGGQLVLSGHTLYWSGE